LDVFLENHVQKMSSRRRQMFQRLDACPQGKLNFILPVKQGSTTNMDAPTICGHPISQAINSGRWLVGPSLDNRWPSGWPSRQPGGWPSGRRVLHHVENAHCGGRRTTSLAVLYEYHKIIGKEILYLFTF
jgi:hypothetical protein